MDTLTAVRARLELTPHLLIWEGYSGYPVTGEDVARHMEAVRNLQDTHPDWNPQLARPYGGRELQDAFDSVVKDGGGTQDTARLSERLLELIIEERTGSRLVHLGTWARHPNTTKEVIAEHLTTAAAFARALGPKHT